MATIINLHPTCAHCGAPLRVDYQGSYARHEGGYRDVGGFLIATCDAPDCPVQGVTTTLNKHRKIDLDKYARKEA